ncbi:CoA pyrophosphatase [Desulfovibrio sp. OttesenSCG-928-C14]|nr:CoA pyrophosphatase [Desulfovibrio sp. OttesenSCG-928-C14]
MRLQLPDLLPGVAAQARMAPACQLPPMLQATPATAVPAAVLILLTPDPSGPGLAGPDGMGGPGGMDGPPELPGPGGLPRQDGPDGLPELPRQDGQPEPLGPPMLPTLPTLPMLLDWRVLLIRRCCYKGVHSGQVALPGGKREPEDRDFLATALREAGEEMGVDPALVRVAGPLSSLYVAASGFVIHPFLAVNQGITAFTPEAREVETYRQVPLRICDPAKAESLRLMFSGGAFNPAPAWRYQDFTIWGATAMILAELYELAASDRLKIT